MSVRFKCGGCGREFEHPDTRYNGEYYGNYSCCPFCGMDDLEPLKQCPVCEIWFPEEEREVICNGCREDSVDRFQAFMRSFHPKEREFLNEYFEGEYI